MSLRSHAAGLALLLPLLGQRPAPGRRILLILAAAPRLLLLLLLPPPMLLLLLLVLLLPILILILLPPVPRLFCRIPLPLGRLLPLPHLPHHISLERLALHRQWREASVGEAPRS